MNRERRSRIRGLIKAFKDLSSTIQNDLSSQVQDLHDRGTAMQDAMDELQSAVDLCSEASDAIDSIVDSLQAATE